MLVQIDCVGGCTRRPFCDLKGPGCGNPRRGFFAFNGLFQGSGKRVSSVSLAIFPKGVSIMSRAEPSGISLSEAEAAIVKGMLARGDRQHNIAAWFGVNSGRIANVANGSKFPSVHAVPADKLPPPGPYLAGRDAQAAMIALEEAAQTIHAALSLIRERVQAASGDR